MLNLVYFVYKEMKTGVLMTSAGINIGLYTFCVILFQMLRSILSKVSPFVFFSDDSSLHFSYGWQSAHKSFAAGFMAKYVSI